MESFCWSSCFNIFCTLDSDKKNKEINYKWHYKLDISSDWTVDWLQSMKPNVYKTDVNTGYASYLHLFLSTPLTQCIFDLAEGSFKVKTLPATFSKVRLTIDDLEGGSEYCVCVRNINMFGSSRMENPECVKLPYGE